MVTFKRRMGVREVCKLCIVAKSEGGPRLESGVGGCLGGARGASTRVRSFIARPHPVVILQPHALHTSGAHTMVQDP